MIIKNTMVGADPELFLKDEEDDQFVPVIGLLGGTKSEPKAISDKGHFVQEDNVMAEFNIPPCKTENDFVKHIKYAVDEIEEIIPSPLKTIPVPSAEFDEDWLNDPQACISGCDPYHNAWKDGKIEEAVSLEETNTRYAGGHVHISYSKPTEKKSIVLVKNLDLFLGIPSVIVDDDKVRRETYGKAGAFREKDYGVEYRSLSNFWLQSEDMMRWVFNNIQLAIKFTNKNMKAPRSVERIINGSHKEQAQELIDKHNIPMP